MQCTLRGARLIDATLDIPHGDTSINGARIQYVGHSSEAQEQVIEADNMIVMPGFIDVHTHGGGGFNLHTNEANQIGAYARWAPTTGVTAFLIAVVGTPGSLPEAQLEAAITAINHFETGAEPLGIHLEGPYISADKRGAHLPSWLRSPDRAETERVLALTDGYLRVVTLAPELPGAAEMVSRLIDAGIIVSIGHTDATYEQAQAAIDLGITHATHCFNAMRPLHHRHPGPLAAIAQAEQVRGELIADGVHVHPAAMEALVKLLGPRRVIVITDALSAAGMTTGTFDFAGQPAQVVSGVARLADGTITGSVLTMDQALRNMLSMTRVSLQEAVGMLTLNPAHAAGVAERKGRLLAGYDADLLILDSSLTIQATICRGTLTYATGAWCDLLREN